MERTEKQSRGAKRGKLIYITSVLLSSFLLSLLLMFLVNDTVALTGGSGSTEVTVSEDMSVFRASGVLKESGLIDSRIWFTVYSGMRGKVGTVRKGSYLISNSGGYDGVLRAFSEQSG